MEKLTTHKRVPWHCSNVCIADEVWQIGGGGANFELRTFRVTNKFQERNSYVTHSLSLSLSLSLYIYICVCVCVCVLFSPFFPGFTCGSVLLNIQWISVIISSNGPNKLCRYKRSVIISEVYGTSEGKRFQDKIQTCRYINVNAIIHFKFKLQLRFKNNKIILTQL
jgi:hypothetical protein